MNLYFRNKKIWDMMFWEGKFLQDIDKSEKWIILNLMLQVIKKLFFQNKGKTKKTGKGNKNVWAEKQFKEMGKLGGKLILM